MNLTPYNYIIMNAMSIYGKHCLRRYRQISDNAEYFSEKLLLNHLKRNRNTELGKKLGFSSIKSAQEYQLRIPFSTYDDYKPYVERMANTGEQKLMTRDNISFFATTSGTTGITKRIPVARRSYKPILRASAIIYHLIYRSMRENGIRYGKGLNTLESGCEYTPGGIREGYISSFVISSAGMIVPAITCIPPPPPFSDMEKALI